MAVQLSDFEFYEDLEKEIAARLEGPLGEIGFNVVPLPDTESDFDKPQRQGLVTVTYRGSGYGDDVRTTDAVAQDETITIELTVESKFRRNGPQGQGGVLSALLLTRALLLGYKPENCKKMWGGEQDFDSYNDRLWAYGQTFQTSALAVEKPADVTENLLTNISVDDATTAESFDVNND